MNLPVITVRHRLEDLVACVDRELARRARAFGRLVDAGRMDKARADQELAMMREVREVLVERLEAPAAPAQLSLFEGRR